MPSKARKKLLVIVVKKKRLGARKPVMVSVAPRKQYWGVAIAVIFRHGVWTAPSTVKAASLLLLLGPPVVSLCDAFDAWHAVRLGVGAEPGHATPPVELLLSLDGVVDWGLLGADGGGVRPAGVGAAGCAG